METIIRSPDDTDMWCGDIDLMIHVSLSQVISVSSWHCHASYDRCLRGQKGQLNKLNTFVDQRSSFVLRQISTEFLFGFVTDFEFGM